MPTVAPEPRALVATADFLAVSDERDQWIRRLLDAERAAYRAGFEAGRVAEKQHADRAWSAVPVQKAQLGPSYAELSLLRWGPGGRHAFGDPKPGDRAPLQTRLEAAG